MRSNFVQLYVHCVWATWDRLPLLTPEIRELAYAAIIQKSKQLGAGVIAISGIADHVHLLVDFPTTLTVGDLIKNVKGSSSHLINHSAAPEFFKWQGSYGAFTVGHRDVDRVVAYVRNQEAHHRELSVLSQWELAE
jgi:putative transposase